MYTLLRKSKNDSFQYLRPAVARRRGIIPGVAGGSTLPVCRRCCRYSRQLSDDAYQGNGFPQAQVAPLQYFCRIAVHFRIRPDVQRAERMGDLPDHFCLAPVIHGICRSQERKLIQPSPTPGKVKDEKYLHIVSGIVKITITGTIKLPKIRD